jgi:hypothetical protein
MKTLVVHYCNSIDRYSNYPIDHTLEIDHDGILRVCRVSRKEQYDTEEIAVFFNWDYYKIEDECE